MGKYMRKTNGVTGGEVAVMEVQSPLGVRTRAKTLALQRLAAAAVEDVGGSYLQLRSRRLQKPAASSLAENVRRRRKKKGNLGTSEIEKGEENLENEKKIENDEEGKGGNVADNGGGGGERVEEEEAEDDGCCGENVLEFEGRERTRESTPCDLITDPDSIVTPGSSTKPSRARASEAVNRVQNPFQRDMPTTQEMDEFFAAAEKQQQQQFMEKYNFDLANDKPLPGRFEWTKLDP